MEEEQDTLQGSEIPTTPLDRKRKSRALLFDELRDIMVANGETPQKERDRYVFLAMLELYAMLDELFDVLTILPKMDKTINDIRKQSIVIWAKAHKVETGIILTVLAFLGMSFHNWFPTFIQFLEDTKLIR